MTACQKESLDVESLNTQKSMAELKIELQEEHERFITKHGAIEIEYLSLKEMNTIEIENGIKPTTLEDLGVTEEEYQLAQTQINNSELAQSRCNSWYRYLIDIDQDRKVNGQDISRAYLYLLRGSTFGIPVLRFNNFGTISYWRGWDKPNTTSKFSISDILIAQRMILGLEKC